MARPASSDAFLKQLKKTAKNVAKMAKSRLLTPTSTWNHKPKFVIEDEMKGADLIVRVFTDDGPYYWLDEGTAVRYATMTKPFDAKTTPGSFDAKAGSGRLAYVSRKSPKKGIEARKWTEMTALEYGAILQSAVDSEIGTIAKNMFQTVKKYRKYTK